MSDDRIVSINNYLSKMLFIILAVSISRIYAQGCDAIYGGGWKLVRHSYYQWFQSTDSLQGTDVYGTYDDDPQSTHCWSIEFHDDLKSDGSTLFMFSNGDCSEWLVTANDQFVLNSNPGDSGTSVTILASHLYSTPYQRLWLLRDWRPEDPWISFENMGDNNFETNLYSENATPDTQLDCGQRCQRWLNNPDADRSLNVWIQPKNYTTAAVTTTTTTLQTEPPVTTTTTALQTEPVVTTTTTALQTEPTVKQNQLWSTTADRVYRQTGETQWTQSSHSEVVFTSRSTVDATQWQDRWYYVKITGASVAGSVVFVLCIAAILYIFYRKKRNSSTESGSVSNAKTASVTVATQPGASMSPAERIEVYTDVEHVTMTQKMNSTSGRLDIKEDPLPCGWIKLYTDDNRVYYQNNVTKQTQWTLPSAVAANVEPLEPKEVAGASTVDTTCNLVEPSAPPDMLQMEEEGASNKPMDTSRYSNGDKEGVNDDKYFDIKQFFESVHMLQEDKAKYFKLFIENGFDSLEVIKTVSNQDLLEVGVTKLGHRKIILSKAQHL